MMRFVFWWCAIFSVLSPLNCALHLYLDSPVWAAFDAPFTVFYWCLTPRLYRIYRHQEALL